MKRTAKNDLANQPITSLEEMLATKKPLTTLQKELASAMYRRRPAKGCHSGRGWGHSEQCYETCLSSWRGDVNELARTLRQHVKQFDMEAWMKSATGGGNV